MKGTKRIIPWLLRPVVLYLSSILLLTLVAGCSSLEKGGAYAPTVVVTDKGGTSVTNQATASDKAFYVTDAAFYVGYAAMDAVFKWERDNRVFLWSVSHDIKHGLDAIRPTAAATVKSYSVARAAYKENPTPAGLDLMKTILAKLQQLSAAATVVSTNAALNSK